MKVFKFGGASVKDAAAVRNVLSILKSYEGNQVVVVISAMGKTTNQLELLVESAIKQELTQFQDHLKAVRLYHNTIVEELFEGAQNELQLVLEEYYTQIEAHFSRATSMNEAACYDSLIRYGELLSTRIVWAYLNLCGLKANWINASEVIITDNKFKSATVDIESTCKKTQELLVPALAQNAVQITQGFIGSSLNGELTTLGREGSDYSGAILAYALDAESLTIWKDVDGMFNADPKQFTKAQKLEAISYKDAIELSYYGASVIHPKTIQPLQNKKIPLFVKSFLNPSAHGTHIHEQAKNTIPCYIVKNKQVLISLSTRNFAFVAEHHLSRIFNLFDRLDMKINIMQNSAVNFSVLVDEKSFDAERVIETFQDQFAVRYNENLDLITIRAYNEEIVRELTSGRTVLLEQRTRETVRFVLR